MANVYYNMDKDFETQFTTAVKDTVLSKYCKPSGSTTMYSMYNQNGLLKTGTYTFVFSKQYPNLEIYQGNTKLDVIYEVVPENSVDTYCYTFTLTGTTTSTWYVNNLGTHESDGEAVITYTTEYFNSANNITIAPTSPITLDGTNNVDVIITPNNGYAFGDSDNAYFRDSSLQEYNFVLQPNGTMKYTLSYDTFDSNTELSLCGSVSKKEKPVDNDIPKMYTTYKPTSDNITKINEAIFINATGNVNTEVIHSFISFQKFYCDVISDSYAQLKAGKYDFLVSAPYVSQLKQVIDCGSITVDETFHSIVDYKPYTGARIYLPFIGFEDLDIDMVMGCTLRLEYVVDVSKGNCLAKLYSTKIKPETIILEKSGKIASDEPFYQGYDNYKGTVELIDSIQLGEKKAFIELTTKDILEQNTKDYVGLPQKTIVNISSTHGFVKFDTIFLDGIDATDKEKDEIKSLFKTGILVD